MPAKKEAVINLLPQREFEASTAGRILKWALSSFRIIVVLTEMLVMAAFLSRFWLDARNSDLNEQIVQKQTVILSSKEIEERFRLDQKRLLILSELSAISPLSDLIGTIVSYLPTSVTFSSIAIEGDSVDLAGTSGGELGISQFMANLESSKKLSGITLTRVASDTENSLVTNFALKASASK